MNWNNIYITDKNGGKHWNTVASPMSTQSEINNLKNHIKVAKQQPQFFAFLDIPTMKVMVNGEEYEDFNMSDDELLEALEE